MGLAERFRKTLSSSRDENDSSDREYTLERMTYRGGWKLTGVRWDVDEVPESLLASPSSEEQLRQTGGPGRYRLVERVDGPISEVVWTVETDDAEAHYDEKREETDQGGESEEDGSDMDGLGELERELIARMREEEGPKEALKALQELKFE